MIRFTATSEGTIIPDCTERLPGRGIWVSCEREILEKACKKSLFTKVLRRPVVIDPNLSTVLESILEQYCLTLLRKAFRAGYLSIDLQAIQKVPNPPPILFLIQAVDSVPQDDLALRTFIPDIPVIHVFSILQLSAALRRSQVVHVAATRSKMTHHFYDKLQCLSAFTMKH